MEAMKEEKDESILSDSDLKRWADGCEDIKANDDGPNLRMSIKTSFARDSSMRRRKVTLAIRQMMEKTSNKIVIMQVKVLPKMN